MPQYVLEMIRGVTNVSEGKIYFVCFSRSPVIIEDLGMYIMLKSQLPIHMRGSGDGKTLCV